MRYGIVGLGVVGQHMLRDIESAGQEWWYYDPNVPGCKEDLDWHKAKVNSCDCAFVCVPTPAGDDGVLDMRHIWDVFKWLRVPIAIIRSATAIGTADALYGIRRNVVICPEFIGEGVRPPYSAMSQPPFLILGGETADCERAAQALSGIYNSECEFVFMSAREAEIAKLAENYFLALKVTWANEVYEVCQRFNASYERMMAGLTHDYRIGRSHTHVYRDNRGWSSKCLDKDLPGLLAQVGPGIAPLLAAVIRTNDWHKTRSDK